MLFVDPWAILQGDRKNISLGIQKPLNPYPKFPPIYKLAEYIKIKII
jgi:hypothetical protein